MVWTSLSGRLGSLPVVLAGPILRKVTNSSVTVWVATKDACDVRLRLFDPRLNAPIVTPQPISTVALGKSLHMVAITLDMSEHALAPGFIYSYDLEFRRHEETVWLSLGIATHHALLSYHDHQRPTFCLPPANLEQLRIVHGSCRKPHGEGETDALAVLDGLIAQSKDDALLRPQQLLLTGDQIYADDVAAGLLTMVTDAADALLDQGDDQSERLTMPDPEDRGTKAIREWSLAKEMAPYQRNYALALSGLTSEYKSCHLASLGEYLCMYLFVWSEVLWDRPASAGGDLPLPDASYIVARAIEREDFVPHPRTLLAPGPEYGERKGKVMIDGNGNARKARATLSIKKNTEIDNNVRPEITNSNKQLVAFHRTLKIVRRALANIPSYMIFDDHEITDDWNMRLHETIKLHESALGRRVVQNGLVAYALCQHWGNRPEEFVARGGANTPGALLLEKLNGATGIEYGARSSQIAALVGLPDPSAIVAQRRLFHPPGALTYNYTVEGPAHQILFTDTRTWRSFPDRSEIAGVLLDEQQLNSQVRSTGLVPPLEGRMQLAVLSTNAPPIRAIRTAEKLDWASNSGLGKHYADVYESWVMPSPLSDKLFKALSDRLPLQGGRRFGAVVLLSGDVHHSFATRLRLEGSARLDDPLNQGQPVDAVFAQLVSSSFRNEDDDTRQIGLEGHDFKPAYKHVAIPGGREEQFYGWNIAPGTSKTVGEKSREVLAWTGGINIGKKLAWEPFDISSSQTIGGAFNHLLGRLVGPVAGGDRHFRPTIDAHWKYHLKYLASAPEGAPLPQPAPPPFGPGLTTPQRKVATALYVNSLNGYRLAVRQGTKIREAVGKNNLSEITFSGTTMGLKVNHTIRWCELKPPSNFEAPWPGLRFARIPVDLWPPMPQ
jgi:hypothetical protein